jgi:hypothetical protein
MHKPSVYFMSVAKKHLEIWLNLFLSLLGCIYTSSVKNVRSSSINFVDFYLPKNLDAMTMYTNNVICCWATQGDKLSTGSCLVLYSLGSL